MVKTATKAMFNHHFYEFGGKTFHQAQGGPIGLRGTCAIARLVLQIFNSKWKSKLDELGIRTWLRARYVDDSRTLLQPIKPGWRMTDGRLRFRKMWELEDSKIPGEERTKIIIAMTMAGIEDYLEFTADQGMSSQMAGCQPWIQA